MSPTLGAPQKPEKTAPAVALAAVCLWSDVFAALSPILGEKGALALYRRSLFLAQRAEPTLGPAFGSVEPASQRIAIDELQTFLSGQASDDAERLARIHLASFRSILATMIGGSLTQRLLGPVWEAHPAHFSQDILHE